MNEVIALINSPIVQCGTTQTQSLTEPKNVPFYKLGSFSASQRKMLFAHKLTEPS